MVFRFIHNVRILNAIHMIAHFCKVSIWSKWLKFTMSYIPIQSFVVGINVAIQLSVGFFPNGCCCCCFSFFMSIIPLVLSTYVRQTLYQNNQLKHFFPLLSRMNFFVLLVIIMRVVCIYWSNGGSEKLSMLSQNYKIIVSIQVFTQWLSVFGLISLAAIALRNND